MEKGTRYAIKEDYEGLVFHYMSDQLIWRFGAENRPLESYFLAYQTLSTDEIRRLWIAEGKRRGYELTDT